MSDGAHQGIRAERALGTILGGQEAPADDEGMTPAQMRAHITAEPGEGYDGAAQGLAGYLLRAVEAHPEMRTLPISGEWAWPNGLEGGPVLATVGWSEFLKEHDPEGYRAAMDRYGPTGFMWGWAANAVRYCLDLPPAPNPALIEVGATDYPLPRRPPVPPGRRRRVPPLAQRRSRHHATRHGRRQADKHAPLG
jgi:hypothetical protein